MNLLTSVVAGIAKVAAVVGSTLMLTNQSRSIATQTKAIALTQQRDSDNRDLGIKRMEFEGKMEMLRQTVRAKERGEDRELSLSLEKIRAENLLKTEQMRQAFQALQAEEQRQFLQAMEIFKAEVQIALQSDSIAFQHWKTETDRQFNTGITLLNAQINRQRDKQNRDDTRRDRNSPVFSVVDDMLTMVLNREQMPLTVFISPPVLRYDPVPNASSQSQFPMMEDNLSTALRNLFKQYSLTQRPIKFMAGEWITKNRRAESAVNQIYADLKEIPVIVLESVVEESFLHINIGFWNNDFDDVRFETVVRKFRWQDAIAEISQRLLAQWQTQGRKIETEADRQLFIRHNREEFIHYMEVLHCIHVGMVVDEYFLLYAPERQLPFLPKLLPDLFEEGNLPPEERTTLIHAVIDYANALFDGLAQTEPATIVELRLAWAKILQQLPDRYTFAAQVQAVMTAWLQQRGITNSNEPLTAISRVLIPEDSLFVETLNPCLQSLELPVLDIAVSCFRRGIDYLQTNQWQLARLDFDRTISLNPHADAYFHRVFACLKLEDYNGAISDLDKAAMLQPQRAEIYEYRGDVYQELKNYENAIANYNQANDLGSVTATAKRNTLQKMLADERDLSLNNSLDKASQVRREFMEYLNEMLQTLKQIESSLKFSFSGLHIQDLQAEVEKLRHGSFRILVLGEMKRGKSTVINAILGKELLPSDVNPCTAILTFLRYGKQEKVTVHFKGNKKQELTFEQFKKNFTIDPEESIKFEEQNKKAFPDVEYAVVEYPLPILEKGVEIVDSPGLNDTEDRNRITLNYIGKCHAILFVLSAVQQFTISESEYLDNRVKERGLEVFFLINAWDEIANRIGRSARDKNKLQEKYEKIRQVFHGKISVYLSSAPNAYRQRVFEISALNTLENRLYLDTKEPEFQFPEFQEILGNFLIKERLKSEIVPCISIAKSAYQHTHEAVERRKPLLKVALDELEQRIKKAEPRFSKLNSIRDDFRSELERVRNDCANQVADSFYSYLAGLHSTFEVDFAPYQPELEKYFGGGSFFLDKKKRDEFEYKVNSVFQRYLDRKISEWTLSADQKFKDALIQLGSKANSCTLSYVEVTRDITEIITGESKSKTDFSSSQSSTSWKQNLHPSGSIDKIEADIGVNIVIGSFIGAYSGLYLASLAIFLPTPVIIPAIIGGLIVSIFGGGLWGANSAYRDFIERTKRQIANELPKLADSNKSTIYNSVRDSFSFLDQVVQKFNNDIKAQRSQLDALVNQKKTDQFNRDNEEKRLTDLEQVTLSQLQQIESAYKKLFPNN